MRNHKKTSKYSQKTTSSTVSKKQKTYLTLSLLFFQKKSLCQNLQKKKNFQNIFTNTFHRAFKQLFPTHPIATRSKPIPLSTSPPSFRNSQEHVCLHVDHRRCLPRWFSSPGTMLQNIFHGCRPSTLFHVAIGPGPRDFLPNEVRRNADKIGNSVVFAWNTSLTWIG